MAINSVAGMAHSDSGGGAVRDALPLPRNGADCWSLTAFRAALAETSLSPTRPSLRYGDFMHLSAPPPSDPGVQALRPLGIQEIGPPAPPPQGNSSLCPWSGRLDSETTSQPSCDFGPLFFHLRNGLALETVARASWN